MSLYKYWLVKTGYSSKVSLPLSGYKKKFLKQSNSQILAFLKTVSPMYIFVKLESSLILEILPHFDHKDYDKSKPEHFKKFIAVF